MLPLPVLSPTTGMRGSADRESAQGRPRVAALIAYVTIVRRVPRLVVHRTNGATMPAVDARRPDVLPIRSQDPRSADVLQRLLDATFAGVSDSRLSTYLTSSARRRQSGRSHPSQSLNRAVSRDNGPRERFCREALALPRQIFRLRHRLRREPASVVRRSAVRTRECCRLSKASLR